jgi:hypothetical protein
MSVVQASPPELVYSFELTPVTRWSGFIGVFLSLAAASSASHFNLTVNVAVQAQTAQVTIFGELETTVPRTHRVLLDLKHSLKYPDFGYIPRDEDWGDYAFDWRGDHPFTNFKHIFQRLRKSGYYVDFLRTDLTCIDPYRYSAYLLIDSEAAFTPEETQKLKYDLEVAGVSLLVVADWFQEAKLSTVSFLHPSDGQVVKPSAGGASVASINSLLSSYFVELSTLHTYSGRINLAGHTADYALGTALIRFPAGGRLVPQNLWDGEHTQSAVVAGVMTDPRIAIFGDSSCLDPDSVDQDCLWLFDLLLEFLAGGLPSGFSSPLPSDFDRHVETDLKTTAKYAEELGADRQGHLGCVKFAVGEVQAYSPRVHLISTQKVRSWEEAESSSLIITVERLLLLAFMVLFAYMLVSLRRRHSMRLPRSLLAKRYRSESSSVATTLSI